MTNAIFIDINVLELLEQIKKVRFYTKNLYFIVSRLFRSINSQLILKLITKISSILEMLNSVAHYYSNLDLHFFFTKRNKSYLIHLIGVAE